LIVLIVYKGFRKLSQNKIRKLKVRTQNQQEQNRLFKLQIKAINKTQNPQNHQHKKLNKKEDL
jgi:hypothetical protein